MKQDKTLLINFSQKIQKNYNFQYYTSVFDSIIFTTDLQLFHESTIPIEAYKSDKNPILDIFKSKFINHSSR